MKFNESYKYLNSRGFNDEQINTILLKSEIRSKDLIESKIEFYKSFFNFDDNNANKIVYKFPKILGLDNNTIVSKYNTYKATLKLNDTTMLKMVLTFPAMFGLDTTTNGPKSVITKINTYISILGFDTFKIIVSNVPRVLGYSLNSDKNTLFKNIVDLQLLFDVDDQTIIKIIKEYPLILGLNVETIKSKMEIYKNYFDIDNKTIRKMITKYPNFLGCDIKSNNKTSVKSKLEDYKTLLNIDDITVKNMLVSFPQLIGLDTYSDKPTSIKTKIKKLREFMSIDQISKIVVANPLFITMPALKAKIRYMLATITSNMKSFSRKGYMFHEKKVWARISYLINNHKSFNSIYYEKNLFDNQFKINGDTLMELYPLNDEAIAKIYELFESVTGFNLKLNEEELLAIQK